MGGFQDIYRVDGAVDEYHAPYCDENGFPDVELSSSTYPLMLY